MMKKVSAFVGSLMCCAIAFCAPPPQRPSPSHRPPQPPPHRRHIQIAPSHHDQRWIGPALIGGIVTAVSTLIPPPRQTVVVIQQPTQRIWIDGHFESLMQPNGTIVSIWVPGKYVDVPMK